MKEMRGRGRGRERDREKVSIFWFRRDLRLDDNIGLYHSLKDDIPVIPIFIFDKTIPEKIKDPTGQKSCTTLLLRIRSQKQLCKIDSDLMIIHDKPEEAWSRILEQFVI
jgi:deoxyribodipyrimidine photo-lyase